MKTYLVLAVMASLMLIIVGPASSQGIQNVELHGYMLNRLYANPDANARFVMERLSLSAVGQLGKDGTAYAEVYWHPWLTDATSLTEQYRVYVESAYVDLPLGPGRIRFGKGRQLNFGLTPTYPNRKTSQYGILAETFTQDRITGAQYNYKKGALDFGASVFTDQRIDKRSIGDFAGAPTAQVVPHFVDKDVPGEITGELAYCAKLGVATPCFQGHISGAVGKLTPDEVAWMISKSGLALGTETDHNKYGVDATWTQGPFVLQGEWYQGNFSSLKITGYQVVAGYQPAGKARFYAKYAALNNNKTPTSLPYSWDTQQLTIGIIQPLRKGVWMEFEYEKNWESPGGGASDVDNDLLFLEFFTGF